MPDLTIIQETLLEQSLVNQKSAKEANPTLGPVNLSDHASARVKKPLICIEIDTGGATREKLEVFKGDDPHQLAAAFCELHEYDEGTQATL